MATTMGRMGRRGFLGRAGVLAGGAVVSTTALQKLTASAAYAQAGPAAAREASRSGAGYGPLAPTGDQSGAEILALPAGFSYVTFSRTGSPLLSGQGVVPRNHDGMGALAGPDGTVRLIRNHENRNDPGDPALGVPGPDATRYDPLGYGGTITVDFDLGARQPVREFVSLNGTIVNCAGGIACEDAGWITCEETVDGPDDGFGQKHGYPFLVPAGANETVPAVPLTAMGRFAHEAVSVDPRTGIVYETEDAGDNSGFYRFLPEDPSDLTGGGRLQMLALVARPNYDTIRNQRVGRSLPVRWVDISAPDPDLEGGASNVFDQGADAGGARFNRLEGIWWGEDSCFFNSTSGGNAGLGQVWEYRPLGKGDGLGVLTLVYESPEASVLDSPDNLLFTPRGGIVLCEDDASGDGDTHPLAPGITDVNRVIGLEEEGEPFELAVNRLNGSEFAGACFSPDGDTMFVNIFGDATPGSGMTCAITGPWADGPL
ncbi:MAG: PhoX family protein [Actinobacteria bacterium]|nr:PhoX family protein [Actinomycetota bacterium]